jgi:PKD domain-containing protein
MSSRVAVVVTHGTLIVFALGCALCLLSAYASAQNPSANKDEIFGGYSVLFPNGYADRYPGFAQTFKPDTIPNAFDASNTYNFCKSCNFGFLIDGSGHFNGRQFPLDPTGGRVGTGVGYALGGVQYKYHTHSLSPFVRVFVGAANLSPDCCTGAHWHVAAGGGGGLDLAVTPRFSIRLVQADYIYSAYPHSPELPNPQSEQWNSVRLAAGIVVGLGSCYIPPPPSCTALATPSEVWAGDPVNLSTKCMNFNPKHPTTYSWTTPGGKLSSNNDPTPTVDTTGVVPGSYTATVIVTDPKEKKNNTATAVVPFTIKQPQPPLVSCSANPTTIDIGQPSTITMTASDPQGWPLTYSWSATGGQLSGSGTSATLTATNADLGNTITVTGTASDGRTPPVSSICTVMAKQPGAEVGKCVAIKDWGECTFEKNPRKPWRVDNDCKDTLDKLSLRLQQEPNGKLDIVGYTDEKEVVSEPTLGAQRAVNVKYYLTTDGPNKADAARIQPRQGGTEEGKAAHFYFVAEGILCSGQREEGTVVDESKEHGQSRGAPTPKKKAKPATPPAQ